jgi:hypothetical protein
MEARAIWDSASPVAMTITTTSATTRCTPFTLPSAGVVQFDFDGNDIITLTADAIFRPLCTSKVDLEQADVSTPSSLHDFRDPFYASTLPQCFALAACTVIAYMLVIMLLITPRTFLSGGTVILGRRGFTNGNGNHAAVGIGGRPWLQKVAALTVAISLTIATVNTFRVAEEQYEMGNPDAKALQNEVLNGTELKVIRVISDTFLWLAQAQTLIRLFPRHREKVIIKWTAFALILLDLIFSLLNNFAFGQKDTRPHTFEDAVPALSYLFQLALGLLYCAWVIYYGITKRTYAFYHPHMRNICLVALLSVISVIVPVVFFVLDISKPSLAGWGDYVRWVGAAAASVVVWEWVERIEALERNDKKDGVLGREIFDGDEMLEVTPSFDINADRRRRGNGDGADGGTSSGAVGNGWPAIGIRSRQQNSGSNLPGTNQNRTRLLGRQTDTLQPPDWPSRPPPAVTPVSRTDTASAESTVYAVRYHPISESRGPTEENPTSYVSTRGGSVDIEAQQDIDATDAIETEKSIAIETSGTSEKFEPRRQYVWGIIHKVNPFGRTRQELPREVSAHTVKVERSTDNNTRADKWDVLGRLEDFAAVQADKLRERTRPAHDLTPLPVTRIPAPARNRTLQEISEDLGENEGPAPLLNSRTMGQNTLTGTSNVNSSETPSSPTTRDPYTPASLNTNAVTRRGSLSFVASVQRDMDRRLTEAATTLPSIEGENVVWGEGTPRSLLSSQVVRSNSSHSHNPEIARLPTVRIPPPPRRPTSE